MNGQEQTSRRIMIAIVVAVVIWGLLLAIGAYLGLWNQAGPRGGLRDVRRFWIVMGVVGAFLFFWVGALAVRARRSRGGPRRVDRPSREEPGNGGKRE